MPWIKPNGRPSGPRWWRKVVGWWHIVAPWIVVALFAIAGVGFITVLIIGANQ